MLNEERYLTARQTRERYSVSEMSLHRWLKNSNLNFPKPIYINRRRYWRESDLIEWERAQAGRAA